MFYFMIILYVHIKILFKFYKNYYGFLGSAVVAWFACIIFDEDITGIVIRAVICLVIPNIIAIVVFKNNDDYQFWKKKIKEIIKNESSRYYSNWYGSTRLQENH